MESQRCYLLLFLIDLYIWIKNDNNWTNWVYFELSLPGRNRINYQYVHVDLWRQMYVF